VSTKDTKCNSTTGKETRVYKIITPSKNTGKACEAANGAKKDFDCPVDCEGEWVSSNKCVNGQLSQTYTVKTPAKNDGKACPSKNGDTKKVACMVDCEGEWVSSKKCVNGKEVQTYKVTTPPANGGKACPSKNGDTKDVVCGVDCVVSEWGLWGGCDTSKGLEYRSREITTKPSGTGKVCGPLTESQPCDVDCAYSTKVSQCDIATKTRTITKTVTTPPRGNGAACPFTGTSNVVTEACVIDCLGVWEPDGKGCVNGQQTLKYKINLNPIGGKACPTPNTKTTPCDVDCIASYSANWGQCDLKTGKQLKTWNVTTQPTGKGKACPSPVPAPQSQTCNIDCDYTWGPWSVCTDGITTKSRSITVNNPAWGTGKACPPKETVACPKPKPKDEEEEEEDSTPSPAPAAVVPAPTSSTSSGGGGLWFLFLLLLIIPVGYGIYKIVKSRSSVSLTVTSPPPI
jgi:hypothetical protein